MIKGPPFHEWTLGKGGCDVCRWCDVVRRFEPTPESDAQWCTKAPVQQKQPPKPPAEPRYDEVYREGVKWLDENG